MNAGRRAAAFVLACLALATGAEALAHGERNQEPFLRMRTAHFYDVTWSTTRVAVNEDVVVEGRFRLFEDWPVNLPEPDVAFLGNGTPGPVMARTESWINGQPAIQSTALVRDRDYHFRTVLKGRIPGRHHVHPMINVEGAGPLLGPGQWVEVSGRAEDFRLPITTLDGRTIDNLEHWATGSVIGWHLVWVVLAVAWLGWWVRRPLLLPRLVALDEGRERALITRADRVAGAALVVVVVAVTAGGFLWAEQTYSRTIPLQGGRAVIKPLPRDPGNAVEVVVERATYDVPGRSMEIRARITNGSPRHLQFGEFATSNLRFVNRALPAAVARVDGGYPDDLVARNGLTVADNTPLAPGESRVVELEMTDAAWETERLTSLLNDPDNRVGGLLFCYAEDGARLIANVSGAIVPIFTDNATAMAH